MNFRKLMIATCCMAALAAFYQTAQAAPSGGGSSDLRGVTQNWDKVLPAEPGTGCPNWSTRFTCVMNNAAVRDNETGLVWTHPLPNRLNWYSAKWACLKLAVGNRKGWRLPSITELASLIDMSNTSALKLPANMPFIYTQSAAGHWTSNTIRTAEWPTGGYAYVVRFEATGGYPGGDIDAIAQDFQAAVWCVRGGEPLGGEY